MIKLPNLWYKKQNEAFYIFHGGNLLNLLTTILMKINAGYFCKKFQAYDIAISAHI
jgi:hypothetical protein